MSIDYSVYPDVAEPPRSLDTPEAKADYVHRITGAWDYGILPTPATFALAAKWRDVFDRFPLQHSPAYAAFRMLYGWPAVPGSVLQASYERKDEHEGRPDPCVDEI